ncbi:DUF4328 domain-containing protein [Flaviaesturariibacter amylovorans]|uniref:DUF4328 domain-containing protein n=1 Tax=Flaviaesturariibacter amylovorans TaxID=1084520 RepID=A0ABP8GWT9_9BACT
MDFDGSNAYLAGMIGMVVLVALVLWLVPMIFFCITQQNTLKAVRPQNRMMPPGQVWLQLIPVFNLVWAFIVVNKIADSLARDLNSQEFSFDAPQGTGPAGGEKPTYSIGMAYCICAVCSIIPVLGTFIGLGALVCWIIYWVKLAEYKNMLLSRQYDAQRSASY